MNMNLFAMFLLGIWMKQKMNFFYKQEDKNKIKSF